MSCSLESRAISHTKLPSLLRTIGHSYLWRFCVQMCRAVRRRRLSSTQPMPCNLQARMDPAATDLAIAAEVITIATDWNIGIKERRPMLCADTPLLH